MKRLLDITVSLVSLIILSPLILVLIIMIKIDSTGPVIYRQSRVGVGQVDFIIYKLRTMTVNQATESSLLTIGDKDDRITKTGYWLRKYKLDELPQLWNVLVGNMSLVGPRPEVKKYVDYYTEDQRAIFRIKPGLTDYASIKYLEESKMLANTANPEKLYLEKIMPDKLKFNLYYLEKRGFAMDLRILFLTLMRIMHLR